MRFWYFTPLVLVGVGFQYLLPQAWAGFRFIDVLLIITFHSVQGVPTRQAVFRGWFVGMVHDLALSPLYPLGVQSTAKMVTGLLANLVGRHFNVDQPAIQACCVIGLTMLNGLLVQGLFLIFGQVCPVQGLLPLLLGAAMTTLVNLLVGLVTIRLPVRNPD